jgi:hypothetical protein
MERTADKNERSIAGHEISSPPRDVAVEILLSGGHRYDVTLPSDSEILRNLVSALAARLQGTAYADPTFFQIPLRAGHCALSFSDRDLVAITTTPPVLVEAGRPVSKLTPAGTSPWNPPGATAAGRGADDDDVAHAHRDSDRTTAEINGIRENGGSDQPPSSAAPEPPGAVSIGKSAADWVEQDGWFRPTEARFLCQDRDRAVERSVASITKFVLDGWLPERPFITRDMLVTAFGSCFAWEIESALRRAGYSTSLSRYGTSSDDDGANYWSQSLLLKCPEGFVNTFSIRYQLEWLVTGAEPSLRIWHKSERVVRQYLDDNLQAGRDVIGDTRVFVFTLGLAEVWYSKESGKVLWSGVPAREYHPDKYGFRLTSVDENVANLHRIVDLIRQVAPEAAIIFTLSPIPLIATFREVSCISANSVSKAVLRVAVDELMRQRADDERLFYFPSYDMVAGYFETPYAGDFRHLRPEYVDAIMSAFIEHYCV